MQILNDPTKKEKLKKIQREVLALSENTEDYKIAKKEWKFDRSYEIEDTTKYERCLCGQRMKKVVIIVNTKHPSRKIGVGRFCADLFFEIPNKLMISIRRVDLIPDANLSDPALEYVHDQNWISDDDYEFYKIVKKIKTIDCTREQLDRKQDININVVNKAKSTIGYETRLNGDRAKSESSTKTYRKKTSEEPLIILDAPEDELRIEVSPSPDCFYETNLLRYARDKKWISAGDLAFYNQIWLNHIDMPLPPNNIARVVRKLTKPQVERKARINEKINIEIIKSKMDDYSITDDGDILAQLNALHMLNDDDVRCCKTTYMMKEPTPERKNQGLQGLSEWVWYQCKMDLNKKLLSHIQHNNLDDAMAGIILRRLQNVRKAV